MLTFHGRPLPEDLIAFASSRGRELLVDALTRGDAEAFYPLVGHLHTQSDHVLVLDVARFKYPPHWVPVARLFDAMRSADPVTQRARGYLSLVRAADLPEIERADVDALVGRLRSLGADECVACPPIAR